MSQRIACCAFALALLTSAAFAVDFSSIESVAETAVATSPTIRRLESELAAARERVGPASARPDPMLMAGVEDKQIDFSDDEMMTMYMVGASQTFERRSKRDARRVAAELAVRAVEQEIASARAEIIRDARNIWYDLSSTDSQIAAIEQVRELVGAITEAARVRYEVGTSVQAEVLRAQLERSNLEHQLYVLEGLRAGALARLLPLLDLPLSAPVPRLGRARHVSSPAMSDVVPPATHPALVALQAEVEQQEQLIRLAELERRPDISVEASYGHRRVEPDVFTVIGSIELPFARRSTSASQVREAAAQRDAAQFRIAEVRRELTRAMASAVAARNAASQQLQFHEEVLVPQARLAFESALTSYQTGKGSFDAVLAAEATYLRLQIEYFDFLTAHAKAVADYEALRNGARAGVASGSMQ